MLKPLIFEIYFSPKYSISLYQLLYHNSVIVRDH
ncbi:glycoside hydrolase [Coxiella-like endosymbiont of Rhipicephalus sanguineus]